MSHSHHQHSVMPDVQGLLLVAGSWVPTVLTIGGFSGLVKIGMFVLSGVLTVLAIIDYAIKINWKLRQKKAARKGESHHQIRDRQFEELLTLMKEEKIATRNAQRLLDAVKEDGDVKNGDYVR